MADDNLLAKTLQQYLVNPELLTEENISAFSRSIRDKGREMKLHRENKSGRARLLHELGLKKMVSAAIEDGATKLNLHHLVQLSCAIGCTVNISISPLERPEESIDVVIAPNHGLGIVFDGHVSEDDSDPWEKIRDEGKLVASQEWDSGGPGAGAGVVEVYEYDGQFFVFHDAGVSEYENLYDALLENGFKTKGVKKPKAKKPMVQPKTPLPVFEGSDDDGSWERDDNLEWDDFCGGWVQK